MDSTLRASPVTRKSRESWVLAAIDCSPPNLTQAAMAEPAYTRLQDNLVNAGKLGWRFLAPHSRISTDLGEQELIQSKMVKLWNRLRSERVRDEKEFKEWIVEAKDVQVSFVPHAAPGGVAEAPHKQRHDNLTDRHEGLKGHRWIKRFRMMLDIETAMLEVGPTTITTGLTDRPDQKQCASCAKVKRDCSMRELDKPLQRERKVRCCSCTSQKKKCSWGDVIPPYLYRLKLGILLGHPAAYTNPNEDPNGDSDTNASRDSDEDSTKNPDADSDPLTWDNAFFDRFHMATEVALANVAQMIEQEKDKEIYALVWGIQDIRDGKRV